MTGPIDRLRAADPGARLGPQPDDRAESDLRLLLAEPQAAPSPIPRERRPRTPILVTAVVALVVIALTATVLAFVHPRTDVGGSSTTSSCDSGPVAPFSCSPYFSTGGTGSLAFLGTDLFRLSFEHLNGELTAVLSGRCNALNIPLRRDGDTITGTRVGSSLMLCTGEPGAQDHAVSAFFSSTMTYRTDGTDLTFTSGSSSATFSSAIGACLPAKATSPFCGSSIGAGGSGATAFLNSQYRLSFAQSGSGLTAQVQGLCGTQQYDVTVDVSSLRLRYTSSPDDHSCPLGADQRDVALKTFLESPLTYRWDGKRLTLDSAASGPFSSAVFTRGR